jgi:SAM-dependent methyltransferase
MLWRAYALLSHGGDRLGIKPPPALSRSSPLERPDQALAVLSRLDEAVWTAHALTAAAESGIIGALNTPMTPEELSKRLAMPAPILRGLLDLLVGLGLAIREGERFRASPALLPFTSPEGETVLRASLHAPLLQGHDLLQRTRDGTLDLQGWRFTDEAVIDAQGTLSGLWARQAMPKLRFLPGLVPRLSRPGAALLDVGAGAAGLSIALCRAFPQLGSVALEPAEHPAAVGERRVREEGLHNRIEIRRQRVEHLEDRESFDLAFLPQMFLPDAILETSIRRVFGSLRPGGWLLAAAVARPGAGAAAALSRLKSLLWGGNARDREALVPILRESGFAPVIRAPGGDVIRMICARRPMRGSRA